MDDTNVDVVLATYNGARFLPEQLDSLLTQDVKPGRILISDDGSTDATLSVLARYAKENADCIQVLPPVRGGRGAALNFSQLLEKTSAQYVFLCDQDDVWDAAKIRIFLDAIQNLEKEYGQDRPLLVHGDLRVVNERLDVLSDSFFKFQHLNSQASEFKALLVQNMITGCTVVVNRSLLNKALPVPAEAIMHDWWLALVAAAFGNIGLVDQQTISYRQHSSNTLGALRWNLPFLSSRLRQLLQARSAGLLLQPIIAQAGAFVIRYRDDMPDAPLQSATKMAKLAQASPLGRILSAATERLHKQGFLRSLGFYWALLIARF